MSYSDYGTASQCNTTGTAPHCGSHSIATYAYAVVLQSRNEGVMEVMAWGYNGYGELGLGDTDMRIIPTTVSALSNARALEVSCGDRHTAVRTSHRPVLACESPLYRPFYQIIEEVLAILR